MSENYYKELAKFQKDNGVKTDENLVEKYANKQIEKLEKAMEGKSSYKDIIIENQQKKINKQKEVLDKIKEIINHYAIENEDYSKIYNQEEQEILELLEEIE